MVSDEDFKSLLNRHNKLTAAFPRLAENLTAHEKIVEELQKKCDERDLEETTKRTEMENRMLNFESNYQMCSKETAQMERIKSSDNIFQKEIHQINMKLNNLNREYEIVASSIKDKSKCIDENRKHVDEMVEDIDYLKSHLIQKSVPIERKNPVDSQPTRAIQCPLCDKNFQYSHELENHMTIHSGEKPFKCECCGKGFYLKWRLTKHRTMHNEKKMTRDCHYFNNVKLCPFEENGCKFVHRLAGECTHKENCKDDKCQYSH